MSNYFFKLFDVYLYVYRKIERMIFDGIRKTAEIKTENTFSQESYWIAKTEYCTIGLRAIVSLRVKLSKDDVAHYGVMYPKVTAIMHYFLYSTLFSFSNIFINSWGFIIFYNLPYLLTKYLYTIVFMVHNKYSVSATRYYPEFNLVCVDIRKRNIERCYRIEQ